MMPSEEYQKLWSDARAYLSTRYDLLRLELLDKLSRIIGLVLMALVVVLLVLAVLAFLGMAAAFALAEVMPMWLACCLLAVLFLLLIVVTLLCKNRWFVNPVVAALSAILFADDDATPAEPQDATEAHETRKEAKDE